VAESLVLANLIVDPSGVVAGIKQSNAALGQGDAALKKFGDGQRGLGNATDLVINRMFSFRAALVAVTRVLGIGAVILTLANALKDLVVDLVTSTEWFKSAKSAVTDYWMALAHGEDTIQRTARHMKDLLSGTGIDSATGTVAKLDELKQKRKELVDQMSSTPKGLARMLMGEDLEAVNKGIDDLTVKMLKMGATAKQVGSVTEVQNLFTRLGAGGTLQPGTSANLKTGEIEPPAAPLKNQEALASETASIQALNLIIFENARARQLSSSQLTDQLQLYKEGQFAIEWFGAAIGAVDSTTGTFSETLNLNAGAWESVGDAAKDSAAMVASASSTISESMAEAQKASELYQAALDVSTQSASMFASGLAEAAVTGSVSWKKLIGDMLMNMGTMLLAMSLVATVRALLGEENQWATAVYSAIAATVVLGFARAMGAGRGGASSGGGGVGGGWSRGGNAATASDSKPLLSHNKPSMTINVQGSIIGTDPDNLARDLARLINTAQADGSP